MAFKPSVSCEVAATGHTGSQAAFSQCWQGIGCDIGVLTDRFSAPTLENVQLIVNGRSGLLTRNYSYPIVRADAPGRTTIANNEIGIRMESNSSPRLGNVNNSSPLDNGLNFIRDNIFFNVINDTPALIKAENNFWRTADLVEIDNLIFDDDED